MRHINGFIGLTLVVSSGAALASPPTQIHTLPQFPAPVVVSHPAPTAAAQMSTGLPVSIPVPQAAAAPQPSIEPGPDQFASPQGISALVQLDQLRTEEAILSETYRVVQLRSDIAKASSGGRQAPPGPLTVGTDSSVLSPPQMVILPSVKSIAGMGGRLIAELIYPDGSTLRIHPGSKLSDGSMVERVDHDGVTVLTRFGARVLPMYNPNSDQSGSQNTAPPLQAAPIPTPRQTMPPSTDSAGNPGTGSSE